MFRFEPSLFAKSSLLWLTKMRTKVQQVNADGVPIMSRLKTLAKAAPLDTAQDVIGVLAIAGLLCVVLYLPALT